MQLDFIININTKNKMNSHNNNYKGNNLECRKNVSYVGRMLEKFLNFSKLSRNYSRGMI
jgi:hypothetical protein